MVFDDLKKLAAFFLQNYEFAWKRNAALELLLRTYPMPDGSKGIPRWQEIADDWVEQEEAKALAQRKFAPWYERIHQARQESELLELLRKLPPQGGIQ